MTKNQFQGVVINASFPRSGHRFLRELCMGYYAKEMYFFDSYSQNMIVDGRLEKNTTLPANYIKTHDFDLQGFNVFKDLFPIRRKYIVQVRHPLEAIASYYEFALKNNEVLKDSQKNWEIFLREKLAYWKAFCATWLAEESSSVLLVTYENLYHATEHELKRVIQFISDEQIIDEQRILSLIKKKSFNQYVGEKNSSKTKKRELSSFQYFNKQKFESIENELFSSYLNPLGIKRLLV